MTKLTIGIRGLMRQIVSVLPRPAAELLRKAKRAILNRRAPREVFTKIAAENTWDGTESVSGPGSTMAATALLRAALPNILAKYEVRSLLDIPCGDAHWIVRTLPSGIDYTGADIVPALIERNRADKSNFGRFEVLDLVSDDLPKADLVMVRDCFIHLPHSMIRKAIDNVKRSGARYLLTTTYPGRAQNIDIEIGGFRPIDLQKAPYNLPKPIDIVLETQGATSRKSMALWDVTEL